LKFFKSPVVGQVEQETQPALALVVEEQEALFITHQHLLIQVQAFTLLLLAPAVHHKYLVILMEVKGRHHQE